MERIAAHEVATQLFDLCRDGTVAVILAVGFAPADHAAIGRNAHKHEILPPARIDRKTFDARDTHFALRCEAQTNQYGRSPLIVTRRPDRSEEHTSELQSLR